METNDLCKIEFLKIELFDHLTVCKLISDVLLNCYWYIAVLGTI